MITGVPDEPERMVSSTVSCRSFTQHEFEAAGVGIRIDFAERVRFATCNPIVEEPRVFDDPVNELLGEPLLGLNSSHRQPKKNQRR